jgi:glycoprotein 2-beta-D-xylosyltransferase
VINDDKNSIVRRKLHKAINNVCARFVLSRHQIEHRRTLDCANVSVLLVWRRNYVTHPRNPSAIVRRKIANEHQLETYLRRHNPTMGITGVQLDLLAFDDQLRTVVASDVMIGMHGAGLTHAMFLSPGSALIELLPGYNMAANGHFRAIARWRQLTYENWVADQLDEDATTGYTTTVPPEAVNRLLRKAVNRMCSRKKAGSQLNEKRRM